MKIILTVYEPVALVIIVAASVIAASCGEMRPSLTPGETGRLVCSGTSNAVGLGVTKDDCDALVEAQTANDQYGIRELLITHRVYAIPCSTRVLVLDEGFTRDKVRIVDGEYAGRAGWIVHGAAR
jgi:hypothetical protein